MNYEKFASALRYNYNGFILEKSVRNKHLYSFLLNNQHLTQENFDAFIENVPKNCRIVKKKIIEG